MNFFTTLWYADVLSFGAAGVAGLVAVMSIGALVNVIRHEGNAGAIAPQAKKRFVGVFTALILASAVGVMTNNLVLFWIAMQAFGLVSIVGLFIYARNNAKDVARRLAVRVVFGGVCSAVGVGILVVIAQQNGLALSALGSMPQMSSIVSSLPIHWLRAGFLLAFLGFGVTIGIAPFHLGRAELFSKIPSPLTAGISALSLLVGTLGLFRLRLLLDAAHADGGIWTGYLFLGFGLATAMVGALAVLRLHNYKVWFTDASMFHTGLVLAFAGSGLAGVIPALMHLSGTVIMTATLFILAGMLHATFKTTKIPGIRKLFQLLPFSASLLMIVMAGMAVLPVSSLFMSALVGLGYGLQWHFGATILLILTTIIASTAAVRFVLTLVQQEREELVALQPVRWKISTGSVLIGIAALGGLGWYMGTQQGIKYFVTAAQLIAQL